MKSTVVLIAFLLFWIASFTQQNHFRQKGNKHSAIHDDKRRLSSINFYRLTNEEGLSQASANVIFKDSDGFLWIGTDDGLNRYDGKEVKRYYYHFDDNTTIAANEVYGICEDKTGRIWVAHYNSGISILDKRTEKFKRLSSEDENSNKLSSNRIYGLYCDKLGNIWARSEYGISSINPTTFTIKNFDNFPVNQPGTVNIEVVETKEHIWFGSKSKGLLRVRKTGATDSFKKWNLNKHGTSVCGIYNNADNELLVTSEKGLFKVSQTENDFDIEEVIRDTVAFSRSSKVLRVDNTSSLVWIATDLDGILIADINERKIVRNIKSLSVKDNLVSNTIFDLLQDEEKNVFVATSRGVNIYSPYSRMFNNYENVFRNIPDFGHPVYAIHELYNGDLLIGTKYGGAYYFNATTLQVKSIPSVTDEKKVAVYHFTRFGENKFLAGTSKGIHLYEITQPGNNVKELKSYKELNVLDTFFVTDILVSNDSIAYIASFTEGFFKWNYKSHVLKQYQKNQEKLSQAPVDNRLLDLSFTKEKDIMICTKNGFSIFYPSGNNFVNFVPGKNYPYELPAKNIKNAYDDGKYIWISTYGAGVQRFDKQKRIFKAYTSANGLPNDAVYAVLPDDDGRLWISTNNGLGLLDTKSGNIQLYTTQDGLPDNEFNAYAGYKSNTGLIFYSTINGIVSINPSLTAVNPYNAKVVLTYIGANNGNRDTTSNTYKNTSYTFPAGYNAVIFKFAALSFAAPDKNNYKVKLEGLDKEWLFLKNVNEVRYPKIPPGKYTFVVQASNNNGKWSTRSLRVNLTVLPFWYETWWFKLLVVLAVASLLYAFYHYRISQILKLEKFRRKISSDLHDDIGATLSSINIYSELAKSEKDNRSYLDSIQQNTLSTINSLDDLVWSINPKNDSIEILIERMRFFAVPFLEARKIRCEFLSDKEPEDSEISLEQRASLYLAFKEMINNVVKHAESTFCSVKIIQKGRSFSIEVKDNGKGFSIEKINGHRNGLKNLRERAKENNGRFEIISKPGQGAALTFKANFK
ncbi:sensor histidine kinase [Segetibacter sp.]|uniref:ligand-binding sensor domain-containing protein n=1 Tax=Segetibacter sp. TaxID=2231182 RepID=UPI00261A1A79|nr:sensor histidine kinase [Segetibacter sp.]MCW3080304.1 hypothetical protein [Segetibacter sp.]